MLIWEAGASALSLPELVPDFIALTSDEQTRAAAKTVAQVLWDDLAFERDFARDFDAPTVRAQIVE